MKEERVGKARTSACGKNGITRDSSRPLRPAALVLGPCAREVLMTRAVCAPTVRPKTPRSLPPEQRLPGSTRIEPRFAA